MRFSENLDVFIIKIHVSEGTLFIKWLKLPFLRISPDLRLWQIILMKYPNLYA